MKMKREAMDAFDKHPDELVRIGIENIIGEYLVRDSKEWNDGSVGTVRMSPKEFRDLLAFMASDVGSVDAGDPSVESNPIGETNENQENGSNFVPGA